MKRKIIAVLLSVLTLLSFSIHASAMAVKNQISPRWQNMNEVTIDIEFDSNNVGNASVKVSRVYGVTQSIEADFTVYRKSGNSWIYVTDTSGQANGSLYLEVEFNATKGTTYKAVADITAYSATSSESETLEYQRTC